jgi:hypothetical protein
MPSPQAFFLLHLAQVGLCHAMATSWTYVRRLHPLSVTAAHVCGSPRHVHSPTFQLGSSSNLCADTLAARCDARQQMQYQRPVLQPVPGNQPAPDAPAGLGACVSQQLQQRWMNYRPPPSGLSGVPASHTVPECSFVVDTFSQAAQKSGARHFFLTHFHAGEPLSQCAHIHLRN